MRLKAVKKNDLPYFYYEFSNRINTLKFGVMSPHTAADFSWVNFVDRVS